MLDLIILVVLLAGIGVGAKRGFIVQMMHIVGFVVALIVAYIYYKPLAQNLYFGFRIQVSLTQVALALSLIVWI